MKRKPKLPVASAVGRREVNLGDSDWERIERVYKRPVPPVMRKQVQEATKKFIEFAVFELTARPLKNAEQRLAKVMKGAQDFWSAMLKELTGGSDEAVYVKHLIRKHFLDPRVPEDSDKIRAIVGIMTSFVAACDLAKDELCKREPDGFRQGSSWEEWVRRLTAIAKETGLPHGARKDKSATDATSPFVALVDELQQIIPDDYRRHTHSTDALAKAIERARDATRAARHS